MGMLPVNLVSHPIPYTLLIRSLSGFAPSLNFIVMHRNNTTSGNDRMSYLEERLRQMEEALSRSYTQPPVPISTQGAFREEHARTPPPNQLSAARQAAPSTGQEATYSVDPSARNMPRQEYQESTGRIDTRALSPITTRYQPIQTQSYQPIQPQTQPGMTHSMVQDGRAFQPFLGIHSLSTEPLSTANVNQARRASATTSAQRTRNGRPTSSLNGSRRSTPGALASRMNRVPTGSDLEQACRGDNNTIRVQVRVYPPDDDELIESR